MRGDQSGKASEDVIFEGRLKDSRREARGSPIPALLHHPLPVGHLSAVPALPSRHVRNQTTSQCLYRLPPGHLFATLSLPSPSHSPLSSQRDASWKSGDILPLLSRVCWKEDSKEHGGGGGRRWGSAALKSRFCQFDSCDSGKFFCASLSLSICEMGTTRPTLT